MVMRLVQLIELYPLQRNAKILIEFQFNSISISIIQLFEFQY